MPKIDLTENNFSHTAVALPGGNKLNRGSGLNLPGADLNSITQDINSMRTYLLTQGYTTAQLDKMLKNDLIFAVRKKYGANTAATVTSITLGGTSTVAGTGTSQQTATAVKSSGPSEVVTSRAVWTSSDVTKATVNASGLVTGVAAGTTTITASYGGKAASKVFTVT